MKKRIFSGVQPSGTPTLGNYLGAFQNWVKLQDEYDCLYCVVDMHAITTRRDPKELSRQTRELFATLLALGLDPEKNILFVQSHVPAHAELTWILNCYTMFGELSRMTQFKDKSQKNPDNINAGLFGYPVLMAADILLYGAHLVPVGGDQKQHCELTRDIAVRFNSVYGDVFTLPEPYIPPAGARIMSLTDPLRKMDKSDPNPASHILLSDEPDVILKKCKRATTDSEASVRYAPQEKPGVSNLMSIYSLCTGKSNSEIEKEFQGQGYGSFKMAVGEAVAEKMKPLRERTRELMHSSELDRLMVEGAFRARALAVEVMEKVRHAIGFIPSP